jgi:putative MATE family efflux protein
MINVLLINIFAALATGGAVVTAQYLGARNRKKACESADQLMVVTIVISIFIMGLTLLFQRPLLRLFFGAIEDDVMSACITYLWISALSYPFLAVYNSCAALFRAMGNSKVSMLVSLAMNVINVAGNAFFIFTFQMGVAGVATASLISRVAACAIMVVLLSNPGHQVFISLKWEYLKPDFPVIKKILHIGIPNGLENSFFQLGRVLVVSIISGFGTVQIAANAVANNLDGMHSRQRHESRHDYRNWPVRGRPGLRPGFLLYKKADKNRLSFRHRMEYPDSGNPSSIPKALQPFGGDHLAFHRFDCAS